MRLFLFFFLSSLISLHIIAQDATGYLINKNGDTIIGKVLVPIKTKVKIGASSQGDWDPLKDQVPFESKEIEFSKLTFEFKFAEDGLKFKKIDRLKVKGFGFVFNGQPYHFISWDVSANKQLFLIPATGNVVPDGVYFILHSVSGALPIYSLFQEIEASRRNSGTKEYDGQIIKRDLVFHHPTKGFIYISDQYPLLMKIPDVIKYLSLEDSFAQTLTKKESLFEIVVKYNQWKKTNSTH